MNVKLQGSNNMFTGNSSILYNKGLKSTQEKLERQEKRDNQIAFFENQKNNLKNMECNSLEEISRKLELFHSYEDQIKAAKAEYNSSQMMHFMDEMIERAEKLAEAAEEYAPKTPEERTEEMLEEALGIEEEKGELMESMEELAELAEEMSEELLKELPDELSEESIENMEELPVANAESFLVKEQQPEQLGKYKRIDLLI